MTVFDHQRLTNAVMQLDIDGLRRGLYTDKYFENVYHVLSALRETGYAYAGQHPRPLPIDLSQVKLGEMRVEAQVFTRRKPSALIAGIDAALAMLRGAAGYWEGDHFRETWDALEVEAVEDGMIVEYDGQPEHVRPVLKIRGLYRDFAMLETTILGVLTRASRIATNVYEVLKVSNGKPILFFPARFDLPAAQPVDGYAYWLAVGRYNHDFGKATRAAVSTDAQAAWWGGRGGGTTPHALIAAFFGDTAESMVAFARHLPLDVPRIALVDFNNDTVTDSVRALDTFWPHYRDALANGDAEGQRRWRLDGVRIDTSPNVRDASLGEGDPYGINPKQIRLVRAELDRAWERWHVPAALEETARAYCRSVRIVATGGFDRRRIEQYEAEGVPVDIYGVGSTLLRNDSETGTDFTMDVVRAEIDGVWHEVAKVGRRANDNPDLRRVDLGML
jgi:nicotinate phosphoribosyltransferase